MNSWQLQGPCNDEAWLREQWMMSLNENGDSMVGMIARLHYELPAVSSHAEEGMQLSKTFGLGIGSPIL